MTTPVRDLTRPLLAFWVGDDDIYAAEDEAQALALANAIAGPGTYGLDDVMPVSADTLDDRLRDEAGRLAWTLRGLLLDQKEPGYLAGYEQ
ncbi:hypothetical protein [Pseudomonas sp. Au-Pse12]|uniref:hypothetical protein n=1 Tax=Pseudomonas sp. Au-Pse12 TaxID=2906459 RepID=UPI001E342696|nr:hypothetical protein [Pseudomonas sp. Au-Pse12]MCE4058480.1 hypothetical protein [Pseudomonas sp. Au-Pse12]